MRVVASSKASQEQLRTFQAHIDELNAIIRNREQQAAKVQAQQQQQQQQQKQQPPQRPQNINHNSPPDPMPNRNQPSSIPAQHNHVQNGAPQVRHEPDNTLPASARPTQTSQSTGKGAICIMVPPAPPPPPTSMTPDSSSVTPSPTPRSLPPTQPVPSHSMPPGPPPPQPQTSQIPPPPARARNSQQYGSPTTYYHQTPPPTPPPKPSIKAVVFEFTSPLTPYGSSTSGHAGSGDRYLFPENSILEFLPGGNTVIASFLIVREVDPNTKFPIEPTSEITTKARGKASRSKKGDKDKDKDKSSIPPQGLGNPPSTPLTAKEEASDKGDGKDSESKNSKDTDKGTLEVSVPAKKEGVKNKNGETPTLKVFYQPVTIRIYSPRPSILEPLSRIVKPPAEVRKYMEGVMERAERAPERFPALRLPRVEGGERTDLEEPSVNGGGRNPDDDSGVENNINRVEEEDEEEELKEFYDTPDGLPPLRV